MGCDGLKMKMVTLGDIPVMDLLDWATASPRQIIDCCNADKGVIWVD